MTVYPINTDNNVGVSDTTAGDVLVIKQGVTVATDAHPFVFTGGQLSATVAGTVVTEPNGTGFDQACIRTGVGVNPDSGGSVITVTASGTLSGGVGMYMNAGNNTLNNAGIISGTNPTSGFGAFMNGFNNTVNNSGSILGNITGVVGDFGNCRIVNGGTIMATNAASGYAVRLEAAGSSVVNTGMISGAVQGIRLESGSCSVTNDGVITGSSGNGIFTTGTLEIISNTGTVSGGANGMHLNAGNCTVTNDGTISGLTGSGIVSLGNLQNVFNTGTISGDDHGIANVALAGTTGLLVENSGMIASSGFYSSAVYSAGRLRLDNTGTIVSGGYYGVYSGASTITNSGTIAALYGIAAIALKSTGTSTITNLDTGIISGSGASNSDAIRNLGTGVLTLVNHGQINGEITLGSNADSYDGTLGKVTGVIDGGAGNDAIAGGVGRELIKGGTGNDDLDGGGGYDTFLASNNDGNDLYDGGDGIDRISFVGVTKGGIIVDLAGQSASGISPANIGVDIVLNIENIIGTAFADSVSGNDVANVLSSGAGADALMGLDGNDRLLGDAGADDLTGGNAKDYLTGGADSDTFRYLAAADSTSSFVGSDRILDFVSDADVVLNPALAADVINLSAIDADGNAGNGNQAFSFIGYANSPAAPPAFTNVAGQLRTYTNASGTTTIEADINGDSVADFRIVLDGTHTMAASDFVL